MGTEGRGRLVVLKSGFIAFEKQAESFLELLVGRGAEVLRDSVKVGREMWERLLGEDYSALFQEFGMSQGMG